MSFKIDIFTGFYPSTEDGCAQISYFFPNHESFNLYCPKTEEERRVLEEVMRNNFKKDHSCQDVILLKNGDSRVKFHWIEHPEKLPLEYQDPKDWYIFALEVVEGGQTKYLTDYHHEWCYYHTPVCYMCKKRPVLCIKESCQGSGCRMCACDSVWPCERKEEKKIGLTRFASEKRKEVTKNNPTFSPVEVTHECCKMWLKLSEEEKKAYFDEDLPELVDTTPDSEEESDDEDSEYRICRQVLPSKQSEECMKDAIFSSRDRGVTYEGCKFNRSDKTISSPGGHRYKVRFSEVVPQDTSTKKTTTCLRVVPKKKMQG